MKGKNMGMEICKVEYKKEERGVGGVGVDMLSGVDGSVILQ